MIPRIYACRSQNSAVEVPGRDGTGSVIDCVATQEAGGCPWKRSELGTMAGAVGGIFGTDCWYRGKAGMQMIAMLPDEHQHAPNNGFYGPEDEGLEPDQCRELADWMADKAEVFSRTAHTDATVEFAGDPEKQRQSLEWLVNQWRYAAAWLRWTADYCDGTDAWW